MTTGRIVLAFAGTVIIISLILSQFYSSSWLWVTAFVGANMLQASITRFCPLAILLKKFGVQECCTFK